MNRKRMLSVAGLVTAATMGITSFAGVASAAAATPVQSGAPVAVATGAAAPAASTKDAAATAKQAPAAKATAKQSPANAAKQSAAKQTAAKQTARVRAAVLAKYRSVRITGITASKRGGWTVGVVTQRNRKATVVVSSRYVVGPLVTAAAH